MSETLEAEDAKLVVLARGAMVRAEADKFRAALAGVDIANGSVRATRDAKEITVATWLLQNALVELETRVEILTRRHEPEPHVVAPSRLFQRRAERLRGLGDSERISLRRSFRHHACRHCGEPGLSEGQASPAAARHDRERRNPDGPPDDVHGEAVVEARHVHVGIVDLSRHPRLRPLASPSVRIGARGRWHHRTGARGGGRLRR